MKEIYKPQWWAVCVAVTGFLVINFGFERKSKDILAIEKGRQNELVLLDVNNLLVEAESELPVLILDELRLMKKRVRDTKEDKIKKDGLQALSSRWYNLGKYGIAGHYAEEVAKLNESDHSWSIAGTTYSIGVLHSNTRDKKDFCRRKAISCFENAITLKPSELSHKLNLAITYAEHPPTENPMKGISLLLNLNNDYPNYVPALNALARFGMKTGQYDKAELRLKKAESLDRSNKKTICLLAELYETIKDHTQFMSYRSKCEQLN